ncbi:hypothetical protein OG239_00070 [Streptomyces sp. NBC_00868]|uniref:trypco2 family protein n=1 Tax=unclassified Streptomyces TaxID=2593676 RepID=UPI0032445C3B|nr:hypothetical protein OG239_00070 [Streptomyces sp. NBC_00868]
MTNTGEQGSPHTIGLDLVLAALRSDLTAAREAAREHPLGLGIMAAEVELAVTVQREGKGKAKAMVLLPWGTASGELEGSLARQSVNKITLHLVPEDENERVIGGFGEGGAV